MKKVLQVFASLNIGGAESRMLDVYRAIDRTRVAFDFLVMQTTPQAYEEEVSSLGGTVIKLSSPRESGAFQNYRMLVKNMQEGKYDAVHAHTSYHCGVVMLAAWRNNIPVRISHARTASSKQKQSFKFHFAFWLGRIMIACFATHRLAVSREAAAYLYGKSKKAVVLPNAIDLERYDKVSSDSVEKLRMKWGLSNASPVIGQVGRLESMKNHHFTLEVFRVLLHEKPQARLIIVGDGELREELAAYASKLGIRHAVYFTGVRWDIPVCMRLFDALIMPSLYEGLSGVLLEAQASGIYSVQSDCLTRETDMGLGLTQFLPLSAPKEVWAKTLLNYVKTEAPDQKMIHAAFHRAGFTLDAELKKLFECYGIEDEI